MKLMVEALMAEFYLRDAVVFGTAISHPLLQTLFRLLEIRHESEDHLATVSCNLQTQLLQYEKSFLICLQDIVSNSQLIVLFDSRTCHFFKFTNFFFFKEKRGKSEMQCTYRLTRWQNFSCLKFGNDVVQAKRFVENGFYYEPVSLGFGQPRKRAEPVLNRAIFSKTG